MSKTLTQGPFFAGCNIEVNFDDPAAQGKKYSFENCRLSRDEISKINFEKLSFNLRFGTFATVRIHLPPSTDSKLKVHAFVNQEITAEGTKFGLSYQSDEFQSEVIANYISTNGIWDSPYLRNSPRIMASKNISLIPTFATAYSGESGAAVNFENTIVFEVLDISPIGIRIITECQNSFNFSAGQLISVILEPRGSMLEKIALKGQIARINDGLSWESGNRFRSLGIQFVTSHQEGQAPFHELFRKIISDIE